MRRESERAGGVHRAEESPAVKLEAQDFNTPGSWLSDLVKIEFPLCLTLVLLSLNIDRSLRERNW